MRPRISLRGMAARWSVGRSVGRSVMLSSKSMKIGLLRILNDLDRFGRGKNLKRVMVRDGMCGASVEALKNCWSHFKLIPCFWSTFSTYAKFHPNRTKNTEVRNFQNWSVWVGPAGRSKMVVGISNSFHVVFAPLLALIPHFVQIGQRT